MVVLVSATSVLGIVIVPLVRGSRFKHLYKYVYALMISLGASALFCDAVLHLIPEVSACTRTSYKHISAYTGIPSGSLCSCALCYGHFFLLPGV